MPIEASTRRLVLTGIGLWVGLFGLGTICLYAASIDLAFISAVIQLVIMVLGIVRALADSWAKKHPALVIGAFVILGVLGITATMAQSKATSRKEGEADARLNNALSDLRRAADETNRLTQLNTSLQQRLLDQSVEIAKLSNQTINEITGGESWAYVSFASDNRGLIPIVTHRGESRLSDVQVRIVDLKSFNIPKSGSFTLEQVLSQAIIFTVPVLGPNGSVIEGTMRVPKPTESAMDFNIFFMTSYDQWTQNLRLRKIDGKEERANRVFRGNGPKRRILIQCYTEKFPIQELEDAKEWVNKVGCEKNGKDASK